MGSLVAVAATLPNQAFQHPSQHWPYTAMMFSYFLRNWMPQKIRCTDLNHIKYRDFGLSTISCRAGNGFRGTERRCSSCPQNTGLHALLWQQISQLLSLVVVLEKSWRSSFCGSCYRSSHGALIHPSHDSCLILLLKNFPYSQRKAFQANFQSTEPHCLTSVKSVTYSRSEFQSNTRLLFPPPRESATLWRWHFKILGIGISI